MKTFLWTSLFWIVAGIAGLACLGFGNIPGTPVISNFWVKSIVPNNLEKFIADDYNNTNGLETICNYEEICKNYVEEEPEIVVENSNSDENIDKLDEIISREIAILNQIEVAREKIETAILGLDLNCGISESGNDVEIIDEKQQRRLELEEQIRALQDELNVL